jgi:hypothetical protein
MPGTGTLRRSSPPARKKAIVGKSRVDATRLQRLSFVFLAWRTILQLNPRVQYSSVQQTFSPNNAPIPQYPGAWVQTTGRFEVEDFAILIAHLFVDRSDNLLIGNHIKKSIPDDRHPQPTEARRKRLDRQRTRCSICHSDFFTSSLSFSFQPACY